MRTFRAKSAGDGQGIGTIGYGSSSIQLEVTVIDASGGFQQKSSFNS
jgi:hypothetical protein